MPSVDPAKASEWSTTWEKWAGLPPGTLTTIAAIETGFNPATGTYSGATSRTGAQGLMQFMPIAIRDVAQQYGVTINPTFPLASIMGAAMLLSLTRRYMRNALGGVPITVGDLLAGYNGGWSVGRNRALGQSINEESNNYVEKARSLGLDVEQPLT